MAGLFEAENLCFSVISLLTLLILMVPSPSLAQMQQVPENIRIGALFDGQEDSPVEAAFKHAVNMVNDDRSVLIRSRLNGVISQVPQADSFKASKERKCTIDAP